jgi:hypothetical protein
MTRGHDPGCGCFGCKLRSIQFNPKGPAAQTLLERRWAADMPAYARLRADGIQPRSVDGAAGLEAHLDGGQLEADLCHLFSEERGFTKKDLPRAREGMEEIRAVDWQPADSMGAYRQKQP